MDFLLGLPYQKYKKRNKSINGVDKRVSCLRPVSQNAKEKTVNIGTLPAHYSMIEPASYIP